MRHAIRISTVALGSGLGAIVCTLGYAGVQENAPEKPENEGVRTVDLSEGVPEEWLEDSIKPRERFDGMVGERAPEIMGLTWTNTDPLSIDELEGSPVLLYFWSATCGRCAAMVDDLNALHELYAEEDGLVILGVCMSYTDGDAYAQAVREEGMNYPVCRDRAGQTSFAYKTDGTPDFYLIDGEGTLRIADMTDESVLPAVLSILREEDEKREQPSEE